jgi:hypothetical protein
MSSEEHNSQDWTDDIPDSQMQDSSESHLSDATGSAHLDDATMTEAAVILSGMHDNAVDASREDSAVINSSELTMEIDVDEQVIAVNANNMDDADVVDTEQPIDNEEEHLGQNGEVGHDEVPAITNAEAADVLEVLERAEAEAAQAVADLEDIRTRTEECTVCYEDLPLSEILLMACGEHWICKEHVKDYFQRAVDSQADYPPRCCDAVGRIELTVVDHWLPDELIAKYLHKQDEYQSDIRLRRYCADNECHAFLPPNTYEDIANDKHTVAECGNCRRTTCVVCRMLVDKLQAHDCKAVVLNETNEAYSSEMRFKACPFCGRFGQLEHACNHVTCLGDKCNGEWCFICVEAWNGGEGHEECLQYNDPVYDDEGYDQRGFHRDTGFDRDGFTKGGYNIRGRNRDGERMAGFAERIVRPRHGHVLPGFAQLNDDELRDAIMIQVLDEHVQGIIPPDANLEHVIEQRISEITGGVRRRGLGGLGLGGRGVFHGGQARGGGRGGHHVPAPQQVGLNPEQNLDGEADEDDDDDGNDDNNQPDNPQGDGDQGEAEGGINHPLADVEENGDENAANAEPEDQVEARELDNDAFHAPRAGPTLQQRHCNHNFEMREGGTLCSVCQWHTDEIQNSFHWRCDDCQAITCGNCAFQYAASVLMNWPGIEDADGENEAGGEGAVDGGGGEQHEEDAHVDAQTASVNEDTDMNAQGG